MPRLKDISIAMAAIAQVREPCAISGQQYLEHCGFLLRLLKEAIAELPPDSAFRKRPEVESLREK